jgi:Glycosyl transferases group 1
MSNGPSTIILYYHFTNLLSYLDDWLDAFKSCDKLNTHFLNMAGLSIDKKIENSIKTADIIILHHSVTSDTLDHIIPYTNILQNRRGILFSFVGNEVNLPILGMGPKIQFLKEIEPNFIATQLLQEAGTWLYDGCHKSKVVSIPHALNGDVFFESIAQSERRIDVGTRSAPYGVYLGDNDRQRIIQYFAQQKTNYKLITDLGMNETQRFDRKGWAEFLNQCKTTVSTEAGSFYLEKDDKMVHAITAYVKSKLTGKLVLPHDSPLRRIYQRFCPKKIREIIRRNLNTYMVEEYSLSESLEFEEVYDKFFKNKAKCPVYSKCISSRHFDAIGAKTAQIMFPGRYNDILKENTHYICLLPDFSNIEEVVDRIFDIEYRTKMVNATYEYINDHHTYQHRMTDILKLLGI